MTSGRQAGALACPSLLHGNQEGARDPHKPWDVIERDIGLVRVVVLPDEEGGRRIGSARTGFAPVLRVMAPGLACS